MLVDHHTSCTNRAPLVALRSRLAPLTTRRDVAYTLGFAARADSPRSAARVGRIGGTRWQIEILAIEACLILALLSTIDRTSTRSHGLTRPNIAPQLVIASILNFSSSLINRRVKQI